MRTHGQTVVTSDLTDSVVTTAHKGFGNVTTIDAQGFTTGPTTGLLSTVTVLFFVSEPATVSIYTANGTVPGTLLETLTGGAVGTSIAVSYTAAAPITLAANTTYFLEMSGGTNLGGELDVTASRTSTGNGSITGNAMYTGDDGQTWHPELSTDRAIFSVSEDITAVPEPSTYALILGASALGWAVYRRRQAAI